MNYVLSLDPSGNYYEGKGTTGYVIGIDGKVVEAGQIYSAEAASQMEFWTNVLQLIRNICQKCKKDDTFVVVCEDYRLYASASEAQINSNLETPQLIGAIKWYCYTQGIEVVLQMAHEVKGRWSDEVLLNKNIISKCDYRRGYRIGNINLRNHSMDALRHYLHYVTFKAHPKRPLPKTHTQIVHRNY